MLKRLFERILGLPAGQSVVQRPEWPVCQACGCWFDPSLKPTDGHMPTEDTCSPCVRLHAEEKGARHETEG